MSAERTEQLLSHLVGEDEWRIGAAAVELAEEALRADAPVASRFFDHEEQQVVQSVLVRIAEVSFRAFGGYPKAARRLYVVFPQYHLVELVRDPTAALEITLGADRPEVEDLLRGVEAAGVEPGQVGDCIATAHGFQLVLSQEAHDHLLSRGVWVAGERAEVASLDPDRIEGGYDRRKEIRSTVASLRLDAVASLGFGESRTRMVREIKGGRVKLNWVVTNDPAKEVKEGDVVTLSGRGRVTVAQVGGRSRKGRVGIVLERFYA